MTYVERLLAALRISEGWHAWTKRDIPEGRRLYARCRAVVLFDRALVLFDRALNMEVSSADRKPLASTTPA